jgi:hypothetical protein
MRNVILMLLPCILAACATEPYKTFEIKEVYALKVDYNKNIMGAIADGHYSWVNQDIRAEYFNLIKAGRMTLETVLVQFARYVYIDNALKDLNNHGLRPANLQELLAFGAEYPNIQNETAVIALAASCVGVGQFVSKTGYAYLDEGRIIDIYWGTRGSPKSFTSTINGPFYSSGVSGMFAPDMFRTFCALFIRKTSGN